jgi:hypothetical protein
MKLLLTRMMAKFEGLCAEHDRLKAELALNERPRAQPSEPVMRTIEGVR